MIWTGETPGGLFPGPHGGCCWEHLGYATLSVATTAQFHEKMDEGITVKAQKDRKVQELSELTKMRQKS